MPTKEEEAQAAKNPRNMPPVAPADKGFITTSHAEEDQSRIDKTLEKTDKSRMTAKDRADKAALSSARAAAKVHDAADDERARLHDREDRSFADLHPIPPKVKVVDSTPDARPIVSRSMPTAADIKAAELRRDAEIRERSNARAVNQAEVDTATNAASLLPYKEEDSNPGV
jgi:hypothetical protein